MAASRRRCGPARARFLQSQEIAQRPMPHRSITSDHHCGLCSRPLQSLFQVPHARPQRRITFTSQSTCGDCSTKRRFPSNGARFSSTAGGQCLSFSPMTQRLLSDLSVFLYGLFAGGTRRASSETSSACTHSSCTACSTSTTRSLRAMTRIMPDYCRLTAL